MTRAPPRLGSALTRVGLLAIGGASLAVFVVTPLDLRTQGAVAAGTILLGLAVARSRGRLATLVLVALSVAATSRYLFWRLTTTLAADWSWDAVLGGVLLAAELYACAMLLLAYVQQIAPLPRRPTPLPTRRAEWPSVDVYIPTYDEPLSVVRATVLAAATLDWPSEKLRVYLLDDGRRDAFRAFAAEAGVGYLTRDGNAHAKAGNLNHALRRTAGEFVAVFDCDHVPVTSFLRVTMGGFLHDPRLALVQTPHTFYSPDPFSRNLGTERGVPGESELFYALIQPGLDTWNAVFFCGSCAVLRRAALEEVGGIAVETVTEDAHTALKMHRRGWRTAYLGVPQAAGLATETFAAHVGQRIRWARGMAQIFRLDNPLLGRGLRPIQRLCYLAAMLHFFSGIPRLVFLVAPAAYLLFGRHVFNALPLAAVAWGIPHLFHSTAANARMQGRVRHSFWSEVYETALSWYIAVPTTVALLAPRKGRFNVTAKGGRIERAFFDARIARPHLALLALNLAALGAGVGRLSAGTAEIDSVVINVVWALHNVLVLAAVLATAVERRQTRASPRVAVPLPVVVRHQDGTGVTGRTVDLSRGGMCLQLPERAGRWAPDEHVELELGPGGGAPLVGIVVERGRTELRVRFAPMTLREERQLVRAVHARPDAWEGAFGAHPPDRPLRTLAAIAVAGLAGVARIAALPFQRRRRETGGCGRRRPDRGTWIARARRSQEGADDRTRAAGAHDRPRLPRARGAGRSCAGAWPGAPGGG